MEEHGVIDTSAEPQMEAVVAYKDEETGNISFEVVENVEDGKFLIDQMYTFPINDVDDDESQTCLRIRIKAGTLVEEGYKTIREVLTSIGCDPAVIAAELDMPEILA